MRIHLLLTLLICAGCGGQISATKEVYSEKPASSSFQTAEISEDKKLKIVIFDVGQGDSALVVAPNKTAALIDAGPPGSFNNIIKPYLDINSEIELSRMFISHSDSDHAGAAAETGVTAENIIAGDKVLLDDNVSIEVLAKDCELANGERITCEDSDNNAHSEALLISYGSFKYLTTGDLPGGGGNPPYETIDIESSLAPLAGDIDILHAGHHGSNTSTNQNLLDATKPEVAIISVGDNNDYWHPHQSVIERLLAGGIKIYQTERGWLKDEFLDDVCIANGNIIIEVGDDGYAIKSCTPYYQNYKSHQASE